MQYFISFLEGIITFVSPCLLPMLPIYISYFAGDSERDTKRVVKNALGFILGFTLVFVLLGALAGSLGTLLQEYSAVNIPPQTGQQNGGNRSRVTVEMSPGVRLQVQAVE